MIVFRHQKKYCKKYFSYLLSQNQGNPSELEKGLSALPRHPFGNHTECNGTWCQHKDAKKKYSSLSYGRPLNSKELQEDIPDVFNRVKKQSINLSRLGSSQATQRKIYQNSDIQSFKNSPVQPFHLIQGCCQCCSEKYGSKLFHTGK
jgi:hypothetical protein